MFKIFVRDGNEIYDGTAYDGIEKVTVEYFNRHNQIVEKIIPLAAYKGLLSLPADWSLMLNDYLAGL